MWMKVDDKLLSNRKWRRAMRRERLSGLLWLMVGTQVGASLTDGMVSLDMVEDCAHDASLRPAELTSCIDALVSSGLWHDRDSVKSCTLCKPLGRRMDVDGWLFHDWPTWNPTHDQTLIPIETLRWKRAQGLKHNRQLCDQIVARDGDRCRYCGCQVNFADRRGKRGGTYDHLDPNLFEPNLGNLLEAIVVACRTCNGQKKNRTPQEWHAAGGLELLPPPRHDLVATRSGPGPDPGTTRSDLVSRARSARDGAGQVRAGSDQVTTKSRPETNDGGNDR